MANPNKPTPALKEARKLIDDVQKMDGNEAETRRRVERLFETLMGYDAFKHLSREHAVHGGQGTEHMDFAIIVNRDTVAVVVELKRVNIDLSQKHLRQASHYAIDKGSEWILLTNGRQWELYHVEFGQPPATKLIRKWDLMKDDWGVISECFELISFKSLKKGLLDKLWEKQTALTPECLLNQVLSEKSIRSVKNGIKKDTGIMVHPEDIISAFRKLLNDSAATAMDQMKISLPERKKPAKKVAPVVVDTATAAALPGETPGADEAATQDEAPAGP